MPALKRSTASPGSTTSVLSRLSPTAPPFLPKKVIEDPEALDLQIKLAFESRQFFHPQLVMGCGITPGKKFKPQQGAEGMRYSEDAGASVRVFGR